MRISRNASTNKLIKQIAREGIIAVFVISVITAGSLWFGNYAEGVKKEAEEMNNDMTQRTGELQSLKAKLAQFKYAIPLRESLKNEEGKVSLDLSRDKATAIFMSIRDDFAVQNIKVSISPINKPDDQALIKPTLRVIHSDVSITFKAFTDEQVVDFMDEVKNQLPGAVKIKSVSMTRGKEKNFSTATNAEPEVLTTPQLDVTLNMVWYGFEDVVKAAPPVAGGAQ